MSRLQVKKSDAVQASVDHMYQVLERRMIAGVVDSCPADFHLGFLKMCHAQTCGKCATCRIGLKQLQYLLESILENKADVGTIDLIMDTAKNIYESADCAIGYEAARMIYHGVKECYDEYVKYIQQKGNVDATKNPVPCIADCPANVDVPGYMALMYEGRYEDAVRLIKRDNPFPTTCAFVCEHPCERKCRRRMIDTPVNIRGIKRAAVDFAKNVPNEKIAESTGKKIAIVGGGPSGLSAAYYLTLMGHEVEVYEEKSKLGGMLRYGIPSYRFPRERLQDDIDAIIGLGVKVHTNVRIGQDISLHDLRAKFDAIYIAIGAHTDKKMGIEGEDAEGVMSAVDLLYRIGEEEMPDFTGKTVAVLGGGNVAMDCARSAVRLGAKKVSIVYRRRQQDMPALAEEVESAVAEGVEMVTLKVPLAIEKDEKGSVKGLRVQPQIISFSDRKGRPSPKDADKPVEVIDCDTVLVAIGQNIEFKHFETSGIDIKYGAIGALDDGNVPENNGVFAGGDCVTGPATVIRAIEGGKVAAANIDEYLGYHHEMEDEIEIPMVHLNNRRTCGRVEMTEREAGERSKDFEAVELCMSMEEMKQEANRCLRCDYYGYGSLRGGRAQKW
ncbi:NADPH-dependent glutamate synthase beta subunit-like oxidoreductase [Aequitasia blattaphilus]|uniref:NAD(P)-binding protein n=1 Tax=Aequitasia blattaphilus TaxID=2949332 RepID=A0ABT1EC26_9FIRM|nr:NAD(P)-binding protein [Aequitasia blattaphilus]MCP1103388.1 NAD(P)-binding protein [Aequitasia blattaphilus]MCR8616028.1 NAD(P)-binding protein [Aequitasia blattaphilus]